MPQSHHWQLHGIAVCNLPTETAGSASLVDVSTERHPQRACGEAHVVLQTNQDPFRLTLRLSPDQADLLALNIRQAAVTARQVQAAP